MDIITVFGTVVGGSNPSGSTSELYERYIMCLMTFGILAIHAGVEPGTEKVAERIAQNDFPFYINKNPVHVTSSEFTDEELDELLKQIDVAVSIHGEKTKSESFVMVGGLAMDLRKRLETSFTKNGIIIKNPPEHLDGDNVKNVCNRGKSKTGIQLEISRGLIDVLTSNEIELEKFADSVRGVLL